MILLSYSVEDNMILGDGRGALGEDYQSSEEMATEGGKYTLKTDDWFEGGV